MLETKRVVAYGKRSSRIVYVSNDTRVSHESPNPRHRTSHENATSTSPSTLRKALSRGRKVHGLSTSPRGSPKSGNIFGLASKKTSEVYAGITPSRRPLGPKNVVPPSPSILYLGQKAAQASDAKLTTFSPFVDSDIIVIERPKRRVTGRSNKVDESRIRRAQQARDEDEVEVVRPSRRRAVKKAIVLSDSEDEDEDDDEFKPIQSRRGVRANPIVISDDESDNDPEFVHPKLGRDSVAPLTSGLPLNAPLEQHQPLPKRHSPCLRAEVSILTTKLSSQSKQSRSKGLLLPAAALPKSVLVPRRNLRNPPRHKEPHNPPSATLDLERSFAALSIAADAPPGPSFKTPTPALHLAALLAECGQRTPQYFSTFVQTFPLDDLHESRLSVDLTFRKIGEASYSEVFAIGNVVIKIIPLRDESRVVHQSNGDVDTPQESDVKDVLQEIIVTREMGQTRTGFIKLLRCVYDPNPVLR
jgi:serine/threonine-protein kinase haspin